MWRSKQDSWEGERGNGHFISWKWVCLSQPQRLILVLFLSLPTSLSPRSPALVWPFCSDLHTQSSSSLPEDSLLLFTSCLTYRWNSQRGVTGSCQTHFYSSTIWASNIHGPHKSNNTAPWNRTVPDFGLYQTLWSWGFSSSLFWLLFLCMDFNISQSIGESGALWSLHFSFSTFIKMSRYKMSCDPSSSCHDI